jgi:hypothetical protein
MNGFQIKAFFVFVAVLQASELQNFASPLRASLVEVIANPEKFSEKDVTLDGCVSVGFERNALFLSRFDFEYSIFPNALRLSFEGGDFEKYKHLDGKACRVSGTYSLPVNRVTFSGVLTVKVISELRNTKE